MLCGCEMCLCVREGQLGLFENHYVYMQLQSFSRSGAV